MTAGFVLFASFLLAMAAGMSVSMSMGLSALLALLVKGYSLEALPLTISRGVDSFTLLAIPFFVLAGNLMNSMGLSARIFNFSQAVAGHLRGGLAQVNVVSSMIFSGITGTAIGDAAGVGVIELKAMKEHGYGTGFSAAITLASSVVGPIIPPSVPFVIYAVIAEVSIARLFAAGILPGILIGVTLMVTNHILVSTGQVVCPAPEPFRWSEVWRTFRSGFLALMAPLVILWGMLGGIVTPTEAGILAVVYALFVGLVYRDLRLGDMVGMLKDSLFTSATIMFLIGVGSAMSWVVAAERLPVILSQNLITITDNKYLMLLVINLILLFLGCLMEGIPLTLILAPILMPVIDALGIDRLHFGVIMTYNLLIGLATPPVGLGLFLMSSITGLKVNQVVRAMLPYYIPLVIVLILITYVPALTLWLPNQLMPNMR